MPRRLAGEFACADDWLVFAWDGAGYRPDGTIWGGEALLGRPGRWQRVATLRPFACSAASAPHASLAQCARSVLGSRTQSGTMRAGDRALRQPWSADSIARATSSVGRLFDGAAALLGLSAQASYEGQAPSDVSKPSAAGRSRGYLRCRCSSETDGSVDKRLGARCSTA